MSKRRTGTALALGAAMLLVTLPAAAHKPSDSYLRLSITEQILSGRWDIALRDLEHVVGVDANGDGAITWGELKGRRDAVFAHALSRLTITTPRGACPLRPSGLRVADHTDGSYAVLDFRATCPQPPNRLTVDYRLLFEADPSHRGLLRLDTTAGSKTAIFSPAHPQQSFRLAGGAAVWRTLGQYFLQGVHHIWVGIDHVLFVLTLLLPAALVRRDGRWRPRPTSMAAVTEVSKLVTAFTVAHSLTLALAVLGWVSLPSRLVESVIALSVLAMALNNLLPILSGARWPVVFLFGLVHGFGFASVLGDLGLPAGALAVALLGFNVGVEAGQLAIVAAALPAMLLLRRSVFYRVGVLGGGSVAIALLAAWWFVQRAFGL